VLTTAAFIRAYVLAHPEYKVGREGGREGGRERRKAGSMEWKEGREGGREGGRENE
jgi:hypothetical protein